MLKNMLNLERQKGAGLVWVIVVVIVILLLVWWIFGGGSAPTTPDDTAEVQIQDTETANIASDLDGLDTMDLEAEFSDIEADLQAL